MSFICRKLISILIVWLVATSCATGSKNKSLAEKINNDESVNQAAIEFKQGNYKAALESYKSLTTKYPDNQDILFYYAESLRISGDFNGALEQYNSLISKNKDNLPAIEGKGLNYLQVGDLVNALDQFNMVIKQDASSWRAINAIGVIYSISGKDSEAIKYYNMALQISENNPAIINNAALGLAFSGKASDGIAMLKKSLASMPDGSVKKKKMENNLAMLYGISGKMKEAEQILRKNLPEPAVYNNLGFYAKISSNKELASKYLNDAISSSPVYYDKAVNNIAALDAPIVASENTGGKVTLTGGGDVKSGNVVKAKRGTHKLPLPSLRP